ncbi:MAG: hypothetical protein ACTSVL_06860 [Promethearchaeota archaeon]
MPDIEVNFATFLPSMGTFFSYFEILKSYNFIKDVEVISREGMTTLKVMRTDELSMLS